MAKASFRQEGGLIDYTPESNVEAGSVIVIGSMVAIANLDIPAGRLGALAIEGVFDVVTGNEAFSTVGTDVYWDATNEVATATATDNTWMGKTVSTALSADPTVSVKLNQCFVYVAPAE